MSMYHDRPIAANMRKASGQKISLLYVTTLEAVAAAGDCFVLQCTNFDISSEPLLLNHRGIHDR